MEIHMIGAILFSLAISVLCIWLLDRQIKTDRENERRFVATPCIEDPRKMKPLGYKLLKNMERKANLLGKEIKKFEKQDYEIVWCPWVIYDHPGSILEDDYCSLWGRKTPRLRAVIRSKICAK